MVPVDHFDRRHQPRPARQRCPPHQGRLPLPATRVQHDRTLAPDWCNTGQGPAARARFGQAELDAAKGWNANTLRFQVSQRGLADPNISQAARDAYLQRVVDGVELARSNGFMVIASMQDQSNGCGPARPLPSDQTLSAWSVLAPALKDDPYVMFELFNEPNVSNTTAGWARWRDGGDGPTTNQGDTPVGHQALIGLLRGLGADNVLIADGVNKAERLSGMPLLEDTSGQLMYAIHPYYLANGESWWDQQYRLPDRHGAGHRHRVELHGVRVHGLEREPGRAIVAVPAGPRHRAPGPRLRRARHDDHQRLDLVAHRVRHCPGGFRKAHQGLLRHAGRRPGPTRVGAGTSWAGTDADQGRPDLAARRGAGRLLRRVARRRGDRICHESRVQRHHDQSCPDLRLRRAGRGRRGRRGPAVGLRVRHDACRADVTLPTAPTSVAAIATGSDHVHLTWEPATDENGVVGYEVSRDSTIIGQSTSGVYDDTGSSKSCRPTATPSPPAMPPATWGRRRSPPSSRRRLLPTCCHPRRRAASPRRPRPPPRSRSARQASTDNVGVTHYVVQRNGSVLDTTTETSHTDVSLVPGATYDYVVTAVDAAGNTGPGSAVRVVVPPPPDATAPSTPRSLVATLQGPTRSSLTWLASTDNVGVTGYRVIRNGTTVATVSSPGYVDSSTPSNATHIYTIRALDKAGNVSSASTSATVIAPRTAVNGLTGRYYDTRLVVAAGHARRPRNQLPVGEQCARVRHEGPTPSACAGRAASSRGPAKLYTFYTQSDDAVRLWVNGQQLINSWTSHTSREDRGTIWLAANRSYTIQVDYRETADPPSRGCRGPAPRSRRQSSRPASCWRSSPPFRATPNPLYGVDRHDAPATPPSVAAARSDPAGPLAAESSRTPAPVTSSERTP